MHVQTQIYVNDKLTWMSKICPVKIWLVAIKVRNYETASCIPYTIIIIIIIIFVIILIIIVICNNTQDRNCEGAMRFYYDRRH